MPVISMFYGIIIRMYNRGEHNPPHIHVSYGEYNAVFSFDGEIAEGRMPSKQKTLIQAWILLHNDELNANWELAMNKEPLFKIEPLK